MLDDARGNDVKLANALNNRWPGLKPAWWLLVLDSQQFGNPKVT